MEKISVGEHKLTILEVGKIYVNQEILVDKKGNEIEIGTPLTIKEIHCINDKISLYVVDGEREGHLVEIISTEDSPFLELSNKLIYTVMEEENIKKKVWFMTGLYNGFKDILMFGILVMGAIPFIMLFVGKNYEVLYGFAIIMILLFIIGLIGMVSLTIVRDGIFVATTEFWKQFFNRKKIVAELLNLKTELMCVEKL